jgi:hypothetical protein
MSDGEAPEPGAESAPSESTRPQSSTQPTRRQFLGGLTTGAVAAASLAQAGCAPAVPVLKTRGATPSTTVCPFCGVGCGCDSGSWLLGRVFLLLTGMFALRDAGGLVTRNVEKVFDGLSPRARRVMWSCFILGVVLLALARLLADGPPVLPLRH